MSSYKCICGEILYPDNEVEKVSNFLISKEKLDEATQRIDEIKNEDDLWLRAFGLIIDNSKKVLHCQSCFRMLFLDNTNRYYEYIYSLEKKT